MKKLINFKTITAIFATTLLMLGCETVKENKNMNFNKITLYTKNELCKDMFMFYNDGVGLKDIYHSKKYAWCEFELGNGTSLCIHGDNILKPQVVNRSATYIVMKIESKEVIENKHKILSSMCKKYVTDNKRIAIANIQKNEISDIYTSSSKKFDYFIVCDPIGNTIQFEHWFK